MKTKFSFPSLAAGAALFLLAGARVEAQTPAGAAVAPADAKTAPVAAPVETITPDQWLNSQAAPVFKPGNTLPPLTRFGWDLAVPTQKALAERWHYTLALNYLSPGRVDALLKDPKSSDGQLVALALSNPKRYPLSVILDRTEPAVYPDADLLHDANGKLIGDGKLVSPESQHALDMRAEIRAAPLRALRAKVPIAMVLSGGEYAGPSNGTLEEQMQDPKVAAALKKRHPAEGRTAAWDYNSEYYGKLNRTIADAVAKAAPDRKLYIYYNNSNTDRNRYPGWWQWGSDGKYNLEASDMLSNEYYYKDFNSGYLPDVGGNDILTRLTNAVGYQIGFGKKNTYDWVTGGYKEGALSPLDTYTGFLKCLFISGSLGGNAGYYSVPPGGWEASFPKDEAPHWLRQMTALSQVQAEFSYFEDDLRKGVLLPGDGNHRWNADQPSYEFTASDPNVRIMARKTVTNTTVVSKTVANKVVAKKTATNKTATNKTAGNQAAATKSTRWLVVAWSADGVDRPVKTTIPELGELTLLARAAGSVYTVTLKDKVPQLMLNDPDAMEPTAKGFAPQKVTTAQTLAFFADAPKAPLMTNLQLWFDAATSVEKDKDDGVISWTPQGALADWKVSSKAAGKPVWVKDAAHGLPAVRFLGDNRGLFSRELDAAAGFGGTKKTIFAVYASAVPFGYGGDGARFLQTSVVGEGQPIIFAVGDAPNPDKQTWQVKRFVTDVVGTPNYLALSSTVSKEWGGAGLQMNDRNFNGDLAEILVYDGEMTAAQQSQVEQYLKAKYQVVF